MTDLPLEVTRWLAARAVSVKTETVPEAAVTVARQCILDWFGVTLPGASEPATEILRDELLEDGATPVATLIGHNARSSTSHAAVINGTASHALDFDDVNMAILGHPTVAILPGLVALAEQTSASDSEVIAAFVTGYDIACRAGLLVSPSHYAHGFHATATVGSIGAAVACAHLMRLDEDRMAMAIGIAVTTASGLKSMFGTMCKPFHAGRAAQNGLLAARLAARGYSSRPDALECAQGFAATQSTDFNAEAAMQGMPLDHHIRRNLFKYHASCYLTHGAIEAAQTLRRQTGVSSKSISKIEIRVPPITDRVCNVAAPTDGLEAKFSLRLTVAMALAGRDTSAIATYSNATTQDLELVRLRDLADIVFDDTLPEAKARISVSSGDRTADASHDAGVPNTDLTQQQQKLEQKFTALVTPVLGASRTETLCAALTCFGTSHTLAPILAMTENPQ
jgi:2-methylcitrate dehydratase PrpD